jgi:hypothetical protein
MITSLGHTLPPAAVEQVMKDMDTDGDGTINFMEFLNGAPEWCILLRDISAIEILLEIHVSSVAHAMRGLLRKHGSPIESQICSTDCLLESIIFCDEQSNVGIPKSKPNTSQKDSYE